MKKIASLILATLFTAAALTGCGSNGTLGSRVGYPDEYGNAEGGLGDTMHTYWFDYTVNSAYLCDEFEGYKPSEGYEILVADVTVKNTVSDTITMFDTDFQIQWDDYSDDAYDVPITFYLEDDVVLNKDMLPGEYDLNKNESITGLLVYEIPTGNKDFSISFLEVFEDYTEGDVFFVYFSAKKQ